MRASKPNYNEPGQDVEMRTPSQGAKYLLPKLKSYSQNDVTAYSNLHLKASPNSHYPFTHERKPTDHTNTNKTQLSKLSLVKYQYVSKSPAYFRRQQRSIHSVRFDEGTYHQAVETYVESKIKQFNKQALLDLVNSRVKTVAHSNSKLITTQQPTISQNTINSRLNKTKINYDKLKGIRSSQKFSYSGTEGRLTLKRFISNGDTGETMVQKSCTNNQNELIQKGLTQSNQKAQKNLQKSGRKYNTLQHKKIEFYETKYSHFQPNKIENVKTHIQNIKKYPSLKLNLYNLQ